MCSLGMVFAQIATVDETSERIARAQSVSSAGTDLCELTLWAPMTLPVSWISAHRPGG